MSHASQPRSGDRYDMLRVKKKRCSTALRPTRHVFFSKSNFGFNNNCHLVSLPIPYSYMSRWNSEPCIHDIPCHSHVCVILAFSHKHIWRCCFSLLTSKKQSITTHYSGGPPSTVQDSCFVIFSFFSSSVKC